ncbi:hypothetical protein B296_00045404 [Ensete ventricosum]|uniref:Uncharacterized protein n=1 Tax=Ensete ventricosum TaxID=4639 RepID=A0A426XK90_ENSVE|nr:hypothetical protein B296_00045404 [Ensete ventricosum]
MKGLDWGGAGRLVSAGRRREASIGEGLPASAWMVDEPWRWRWRRRRRRRRRWCDGARGKPRAASGNWTSIGSDT